MNIEKYRKELSMNSIDVLRNNSVENFHIIPFNNFGSRSRTADQLFVMVNQFDEVPIFTVEGTINLSALTPKQLSMFRTSNDVYQRYSLSVSIGSTCYQKVCNFGANLEELWDGEKKVMNEIKSISGLSRNSIVDFVGMKRVNSMEFNKKVFSLYDKRHGDLVKMVPSGSDLHYFKIPNGFHLRPCVPIYDMKTSSLVSDEFDLSSVKCTVFFQINQLVSNNSVVLNPEPILLELQEWFTESPRKKARRTFYCD